MQDFGHWLLKRFKEDPIPTTIGICICLQLASCTAKEMYCDWADCKGVQKKQKLLER